MIIGLTGSYGSGKSVVTEMFRQCGARIIDADEIAREVVQPGTPAFGEIIKEFGSSVIKSNEQLDRKALSDIIFNNPEKRQRLNEITHPRIRVRELALLDKWKDEPLVVLSVPLLLENNLDQYVDKVVVVTVQ